MSLRNISYILLLFVFVNTLITLYLFLYLFLPLCNCSYLLVVYLFLYLYNCSHILLLFCVPKHLVLFYLVLYLLCIFTCWWILLYHPIIIFVSFTIIVTLYIYIFNPNLSQLLLDTSNTPLTTNPSLSQLNLSEKKILHILLRLVVEIAEPRGIIT